MSKLSSVLLQERLGVEERGFESTARLALNEIKRLEAVIKYFEDGCVCSRNYKKPANHVDTN